jgi:hypothetical protein
LLTLQSSPPFSGKITGGKKATGLVFAELLTAAGNRAKFRPLIKKFKNVKRY